MANTKFYIKQNDTGPPLVAVLTDADGLPVSLQGASGVRLHMTNAAGVVKVNAPGVIHTDQVGHKGEIQYNWVAADTDIIGVFNAEFEVNFGGGLIETFPNSKNLQVIVTKELA